MNNPEKIYLRQIRRGDREVFKILFNLYYRKLFLYAKSYVEDTDAAEDIVQDIFFHLWEKRKEAEINSSISAYLFRSVHNRSIQFLRHRAVMAGYEERHLIKIKEAEILYNSSGDFSFSHIHLDEIQHIVDSAYEKMPPKTREIFRLSRESAKSNRLIADSMNITVKSVEYHITKALRILFAALKDYVLILVMFL